MSCATCTRVVNRDGRVTFGVLASHHLCDGCKRDLANSDWVTGKEYTRSEIDKATEDSGSLDSFGSDARDIDHIRHRIIILWLLTKWLKQQPSNTKIGQFVGRSRQQVAKTIRQAEARQRKATKGQLAKPRLSAARLDQILSEAGIQLDQLLGALEIHAPRKRRTKLRPPSGLWPWEREEWRRDNPDITPAPEPTDNTIAVALMRRRERFNEEPNEQIAPADHWSNWFHRHQEPHTPIPFRPALPLTYYQKREPNQAVKPRRETKSAPEVSAHFHRPEWPFSGAFGE